MHNNYSLSSLSVAQTGCLLGAGFRRLRRPDSPSLSLPLRLQTGHQASLQRRPASLGPSLRRGCCCRGRRICSLPGPRYHQHHPRRRYHTHKINTKFFFLPIFFSSCRQAFVSDGIYCLCMDVHDLQMVNYFLLLLPKDIQHQKTILCKLIRIEILCFLYMIFMPKVNRLPNVLL